MPLIKKQSGFTLIELIMVIALLSIVTIVVTRLYIQGLTTASTGQNTADSIWQGNLAMERMVRDIRTTRSAVDISVMTSGEYQFTDIYGVSIDYKLSGTSLMRNTQVLADGISTLSFSYLDKNGSVTASAASVAYITINMTVTRDNANYSLKSSVYLRDLSS